MMFLVFSVSSTFDGQLERFFGFNPDWSGEDDNRDIVLLVMGIVTFAVMVFLDHVMSKLSPRNIERTSFATYVFVGLLALFNLQGSGFEQMLRITKHGGGLIVDVTTRDDEKSYLGSLLLISHDTTSLWDYHNDRFIHLNNQHIVSISYRGLELPTLPRSRRGGKIEGDPAPEDVTAISH